MRSGVARCAAWAATQPFQHGSYVDDLNKDLELVFEGAARGTARGSPAEKRQSFDKVRGCGDVARGTARRGNY